jgi:hypothetical protein
MRIYLDMCCLKRPFDDQAQPRIHRESEAVLALLSGPADKVEFVRGPAQDLENDQNPLPQRASKVSRWLEELPMLDVADAILKGRTDELTAMGFRNFDAFHIACAELGEAEVFSTCDDRLLVTAARHAPFLKVRVVNPVNLALEVFP